MGVRLLGLGAEHDEGGRAAAPQHHQGARGDHDQLLLAALLGSGVALGGLPFGGGRVDSRSLGSLGGGVLRLFLLEQHARAPARPGFPASLGKMCRPELTMRCGPPRPAFSAS
ncbi:MAG: hypothetical protein AVDCRST_MAG65-727 [uncultured Solirubrobacteraceae bacterium]|uniref:Uncharacterized protein n=1 Tax=uncultured Solirubrobacteraceae bacterium TaxID=1162706 RepID=A0A6J4RJF4_9ACTN|nr:MAG: hypothetical protein AVDCRST_MAG65-727 [uncultured Solirubrobacteraceae bacterium]